MRFSARPVAIAALSALMIVAGGCVRQNSSSATTGSSGAKAVVESFLGAVRAQDLQAMSALWGNREGLVRDRIDRSELEKRELIMQCYLSHDKFRILDESPGQNDRRIVRVLLTKGNLERETTFTTVAGPSQRWYVEDADIQKTQDFCQQR